MGFLTCSNLIKTIIQLLAIWSNFCSCPAVPTSQQSDSPNLSKRYTISKCLTDDHCELKFYCYVRTKVCAPCLVEICLKYGRQLPPPNYCAKSQAECGSCLPEYTEINGSCESKKTVNFYKVMMDSSSSSIDNTIGKDSSHDSFGIGGSFTTTGWILMALTISLLIGGNMALFVRLYRRRMMVYQSLPTVHFKSDDCSGAAIDADLLGSPPPYNPEMDLQWFPGNDYQHNYPAPNATDVDSCVVPFQSSQMSNPSTTADICEIDNISFRISNDVEENTTTTAVPFATGNFPTCSPPQSNSVQAIISAIYENLDGAINTDMTASASMLSAADLDRTDSPGEMVPVQERQDLPSEDQVAPQMEDIIPTDGNNSTGNIVDDNHVINEEFLDTLDDELLPDILNNEQPIPQVEQDIQFLEERNTASPNPDLPLLEISVNLSLEVWPIPNWYHVDNPITNATEPVVLIDGSDNNQVNYVSFLNLEGPQGMNIGSDDETGLDRVVPSGDTQPLPMDNMDLSFYGDQLP